MSILTRNGVAKDLSKSPYVFTEFTGDNQVDFHFSSKLHLNNFIKNRAENYNMLYNHIYKRFKFKVNCRMLADCNLYTKVENRGFYIKINGKEFLCPSKVILSGESRMKKSLEEWQETLMINYEEK